MKMRRVIVTKSAEETQKLGRSIGQQLKPGTLVALFGDLGSGKTVLAQGIGKGLGVARSLRSPTFVIAARYPVPGRRIQTLYHVDLYRLHSISGIDLNSVTETGSDPHGVTLIEWAERLGRRIPKHAVRIQLQISSDGNRRITLTGNLSRAWKLPAQLTSEVAVVPLKRRARTSRYPQRPSARR